MTLGISVVLAQAGGATLNGLYLVAWGAIALLASVSSWGFPTLAVRMLGIPATPVASLFRSMLGLVAGTSTVVAVLAIAVTATIHSASQRTFVCVALCAVPPAAVLLLLGGWFTGSRRPILGELAARMLVQILMMIFALALLPFATPPIYVAVGLVAVFWTSCLILFIVQLRLLAREEGIHHPGSAVDVTSLAVSGIPLVIAGCVSLLPQWLDVVMVAGIEGVDEAGVYGVAVRAAAVIGLALVGAAAVAGPRFASAWAANDREMLQALAAVANTYTVALAGTVTTMLILSRGVLPVVLGDEFKAGTGVFTVSCVAQFLHVSFGLVSVLLVMIEEGRSLLYASTLALVVSVTLNVVLIPIWGSYGAAVSGLAAVLVGNTFASVVVAKRTGIRPLTIRWKVS